MEKLNPKSAGEHRRSKEGRARPQVGRPGSRGFSTCGGRIPARARYEHAILPPNFSCSTSIRQWPGSCCSSVRAVMLRAAALSLVLALAAGPNVPWVCTVLCDEAPVATDCQHQTPAASVAAAAGHCCEIAAPEVAGFVPRDVLHSRVSLDSEHPSPLLPSNGLALTGNPSGTGRSPARPWNQHSLSIALRL